jgi:uncharacterized flavoprotein (TIGR03862 family)
MKKNVVLIGGGTANLFLAAFLAPDLFNVCIFEQKNTIGRKFLVAGEGGLNLSHSEGLPSLKNKYTPHDFLTSQLTKALDSFTNIDLQNWLKSIGVPTFVGSSGRIFPEKGIKPISVLKAIAADLAKKKVQILCNKTFTGWQGDNHLVFNHSETVEADYAIFSLGGGSWKITGSNGHWLDIFKQKGIETQSFQAANCAYQVGWPKEFIAQFAGTPLKNISISAGHKSQKGEAVISNFGIEGNAIYPLTEEIAAQLAAKNEALIFIDFKPNWDLKTLMEKIKSSTSHLSQTLKEKIKIPPAIVQLLKITLSKSDFLDLNRLAATIKKFPIALLAPAPIDEAISTTGGLSLAAIKDNFELKDIKNNFCIGEMLDWNAPTGGYLIQACASMGVYLANHLNQEQVNQQAD